MSKVVSPHDKLFKASMSDVRVARHFFEKNLPDEIKQAINFKVLELCPKSYIDENLKFSDFHLVDTHEISDEELRKDHWFGIMAFFMKHIFARDFLPYLREALSDLQALEQEDGSNYVIILLNYLVTAAQIPNIEAFVETVKEGLSASTEETIMTIEEQLIERGLHQGILQCGHEVLMRQLKRKFLAVPEHYQQRVAQANESQIYEWSENLIDARTLDEVFEA